MVCGSGTRLPFKSKKMYARTALRAYSDLVIGLFVCLFILEEGGRRNGRLGMSMDECGGDLVGYARNSFLVGTLEKSSDVNGVRLNRDMYVN